MAPIEWSGDESGVNERKFTIGREFINAIANLSMQFKCKILNVAVHGLIFL